ncbi:hypothetical protein I4U23_005032 [Adineta vaga]|nr:hypothetical protein I4U23_005032 [Adineta vaga]
MNTDIPISSVRDQLVHFDRVISQLNLLHPTSAVDRIIKELSTFCCSTQISSATFERLLETDPILKASCEHLNSLLSRYEYYLETYWAKRYASSKHSIRLENFPDIDDYRQSVQLEMNILRDVGIQFSQSSVPNDDDNSMVTKMVFIGSGPLPISAILILSEYAPFTDIYNIDRSHEANQLASMVCKRLLPVHLSARMHFITNDISQRPIPFKLNSILRECQLIFIAALVGESESSKLDILRNIITNSFEGTEIGTVQQQHILIRTTDGLRQVLYPKISVETIGMLQSNTSDDPNKNGENLLQIESIVHPQNDTRMTIIIARKS